MYTCIHPLTWNKLVMKRRRDCYPLVKIPHISSCSVGRRSALNWVPSCIVTVFICVSECLFVVRVVCVCVCVVCCVRVCQQSLGAGRQSVCIADADKLVWAGWSILPELIFTTHTQGLRVGVCACTSMCSVIGCLTHTHANLSWQKPFFTKLRVWQGAALLFFIRLFVHSHFPALFHFQDVSLCMFMYTYTSIKSPTSTTLCTPVHCWLWGEQFFNARLQRQLSSHVH